MKAITLNTHHNPTLYIMSECVAGDAFLDSGFAGGFFDGALKAGGVKVMAADLTPNPSPVSPRGEKLKPSKKRNVAYDNRLRQRAR
jgi:hypothetical protein